MDNGPELLTMRFPTTEDQQICFLFLTDFEKVIKSKMQKEWNGKAI